MTGDREISRKRYTSEQIIGKLREAEVPLALVSPAKPQIPARTEMLL